MKRFRWSAALVALVLMLSWAGAAQAQEATQPTDGSTATAPVDTAPETPPDTPPETPPDDQEKICDPADGLLSHSSKISLDTASAHPSASASFKVKEGCRVVVFLVSVDENGEVVDSDPSLDSDDPTSGAGEHTLKVDLPTCAQFFVFFDAFKAPKDSEAPAPEELAQAQRASADAMSEDTPPPDPEVVPLAEAKGHTTLCPTTTTVQATTTTAGGGQLPFTGSSSLPMLIAALVMVVGGLAALFAARIRGRQAR